MRPEEELIVDDTNDDFEDLKRYYFFKYVIFENVFKEFKKIFLKPLNIFQN